MSDCKRCADAEWVCENHPDKPWTKQEGGCECGAGGPCPDCNELAHDFDQTLLTPSRRRPIFDAIQAIDGFQRPRH